MKYMNCHVITIELDICHIVAEYLVVEFSIIVSKIKYIVEFL